MKSFAKSLLTILIPLVLAGCSGTPSQPSGNNSSSSSSSSGSGSGSGSTSGSFTIGGNVTGLTGTGLVLQDNGGDNLTVTANGAFTFKTSIASGKTYSVSVFTQPSSPVQNCTVANGAGTAAANVTAVTVSCSTNTATIGGQVTGLSGTGLVLQDNGGDNLTVNRNGAFTFPTALALGSAYSATVSAQPTGPAQSCTIANASGTATQNVGNIVVTCSTGTISIGGSVQGLAGTGMVLVNNGDSIHVSSNGSFTFDILVASGSAYNVQVATQPTGPPQTCTVSNATGTATANVTTVQVVCPAVFFPVGGSVVGLVGNGGGMTIQNNGGDNLPLTGNGPFTFVTQIAFGAQYDVNMFVGPSTQPQGCVIWNYQGLVTAAITTVLVDCGHNDWLWLDGANTSNANGTTTTPPTPPITSLDTSSPGGRKYPATWVDNIGNLWLFGGNGYDIPTTPQPIYLNDMWEYTGTQSYYGGFDTYWVQAQANGGGSPSPTPRWGAITWTDSSGILWLFGGQEAGTAFRNDLWSFNTISMTWTRVSAGTAGNGSYGTKGTPAGGNWPGGRWGATARLDSHGNLWMFGGFGYDASSSSPGLLNDLWEYTTGGQWVWINGSSTANQDGVYGTQGTGSSTTVPGGRQASVSWMDSLNNFWVFGGYNLSGTGQPNAFNDLWEFSGTQWTWVSGSNTVNETGVYGVEGTAAAGNVPGARWASGAWIDSANRLWLFGGEGFDSTANGTLGDLWQFSGGQWTWVKGPNSASQPGTYGLTPGEVDYPHVINYPGTRWAPGYWTNLNGEFFMFGGEGFDSTTSSDGIGLMNDLWRYLPYP